MLCSIPPPIFYLVFVTILVRFFILPNFIISEYWQLHKNGDSIWFRGKPDSKEVLFCRPSDKQQHTVSQAKTIDDNNEGIFHNDQTTDWWHRPFGPSSKAKEHFWWGAHTKKTFLEFHQQAIVTSIIDGQQSCQQAKYWGYGTPFGYPLMYPSTQFTIWDCCRNRHVPAGGIGDNPLPYNKFYIVLPPKQNH